jgi:hypothetical protein
VSVCSEGVDHVRPVLGLMYQGRRSASVLMGAGRFLTGLSCEAGSQSRSSEAMVLVGRFDVELRIQGESDADLGSELELDEEGDIELGLWMVDDA